MSMKHGQVEMKQGNEVFGKEVKPEMKHDKIEVYQGNEACHGKMELKQ